MKRYIYILPLLLLPLIAWGQDNSRGTLSERLKNDKDHVKQHIDNINEQLPDHISMSLEEYEDTVRYMMRHDNWESAKFYLDAADREWGYTSVFCYLYGRYYYHKEDLNTSRRYLLMAVREDEANTEALELLLKIEEREKNYATAIVHVNDLLVYSPYNVRLWRKKIELYRLSNNDIEADKLLERLAVIYPENQQIQEDLIYRKELQYQRMRKEGNEQEVQQALDELIIKNPSDPQYYIDLANSYIKDGRLQEASEICAKGVNHTKGNRTLIRKRVGILCDQALYQEAEIYLDDCMRHYGKSGIEPLRRQIQQEAAQAADYDEAYTRYRRLYAQQNTDESLQWLIRTSMQRGYLDDAQYYIAQARQRYGDNSELLAKAYSVEQRLGNQRAANRLLEQRFVLDPADYDVREMITAKRLREGTDLMQDEMWQQALVPLYQADSLCTDSDMQQVIDRRIAACLRMIRDTTKIDTLIDEDWMTKSIRYEKEHNLDSAYACLMRYQPSLNEYQYVRRHRYTLEARRMKNNLSFEYQYARRSSIDQWNHNAYVNYSHNFGSDVIEALAAYAGRESASWIEPDEQGNDSVVTSGGGSGVQLGIGYAHYFNWGDINIQGQWASLFFPKATVKLSLTENLPAEWTLTERVSWRYITDETSYHLFSAGLLAGWTINQFYLAPSIDAFLVQNHVYFNGGLNVQYFPLDGDRSHIFASVGAGNAPEISLLDNSLPISFAHINTNVSGGAYYMINGHLGVSGSLSWYVIGNNNATVRNYFYLNIAMNIGF